MSLRIDAHQHYWQPKRGDYDWMPKGHAVLDRPWMPFDLAPSLKKCRVAKTVVVQAAATVNESEYLLGIADATPSVAGVVGWVNFADRNDLRQLERLARHPKFCGVRPMIQDIADVNWILRKDIAWAFDALIDLDLTFDALGFPVHLANFLAIIRRYPKLRVVLDHCMKPHIRSRMAGQNEFCSWAAGIKRIADATQAFCKFSGIVTEANANWTIDDLAPFAAHVFACFGADRLMWGSDWPVCQLQSSYDRWFDTAETLLSAATKPQQDAVFGGTAARFYRI